jgi:hypothetical protein
MIGCDDTPIARVCLFGDALTHLLHKRKLLHIGRYGYAHGWRRLFGRQAIPQPNTPYST